MQKLISIIGKAPSELSFPDLVAKLTTERNRVRQALERFRALPIKTIRKKAKEITTQGGAKDIKKLMKEGKVTKSKILELIKLAKSGGAQKE